MCVKEQRYAAAILCGLSFGPTVGQRRSGVSEPRRPLIKSTHSQTFMSTFQFDALRLAIRGQLIRPGDVSYEDARSIWNGMIDRRPAAIVQCIGTDDALASFRFVREHNIPFTVRGAGHNIAGTAIADDALMIDLSGTRGAWVDAEREIVRAQPGATLGDIDRETQLRGQAAVLGFVSDTGATGLTLGGGFGYLTRTYGWTCDNVASMELITVGGELIRTSETEHPDLFWGLSGGGGNFGIVTGIEHRLHTVGPEVLAGVIAWRGEDAAAVMDLFRSVTEAAPRELTCAAMIRRAPPAPWLPQEVHGELIAGIVVCHVGPADQAERDVAPLIEFGSAVGNVVQRRSYVSQQGLLDATQPNGRRYYWKSEYFPQLGADSLSAFCAYGERITSPHSAIILFQVDGALNELSADHSPMGNRDARYVLNITGAWDSDENDDTNIGWVRGSWEEMRRFSTGGTYVNFLTEDDGADRVRAAYGVNFERLAEVKAKWDPENVFRMNKNIEPNGGTA